jgi:site-specific recombinase XerD
MTEFKSFLAPFISLFISFREASKRWNNNYTIFISLFDKYCYQNHQHDTELTQEMVDNYCRKRATEKNNSCRSRIFPVVTFVRFLRKRRLCSVKDPIIPKIERSSYIPHAFTEIEIKNFFAACDEIPVYYRGKEQKAFRLTFPVFFRLLYSSGLRTTEARLLRREDVDLSSGVLNIRYTKGYNQHFVVLHDTMNDLMNRYNLAMDKLIHNRIYFFSTSQNSFFQAYKITEFFNELWYKYNSNRATAYELRHNYAVENINSWIDEGFSITSKLVHLSKSMGHSTLRSTTYYYHLVPRMADILASNSDDDYILPEVYFEEYE